MSGIHSCSSGLRKACTVSLSLPLLFTAHIACRLRSAPFHTCSCPWCLSCDPGISKMLASLRQLGCTFTRSRYWALFKDFNPATECQASSLYDPFNTGVSTASSLMAPTGLPCAKLLCCSPSLPAFKTNTARKTLAHY